MSNTGAIKFLLHQGSFKAIKLEFGTKRERFLIILGRESDQTIPKWSKLSWNFSVEIFLLSSVAKPEYQKEHYPPPTWSAHPAAIARRRHCCTAADGGL